MGKRWAENSSKGFENETPHANGRERIVRKFAGRRSNQLGGVTVEGSTRHSLTAGIHVKRGGKKGPLIT